MPIHATSIIHPSASVDPTCDIGPFCIIEANVTMGPHNRLDSNVLICKNTTIGARNHFYSYCSIGNEPQDLSYRGETSYTVIGDDNLFREFVTVHRASEEGKITQIGNNNFFLNYAHVAHNCTIGSHCIITNYTALAGHVLVEDRAIISSHVAVHQFTRVGTYAMVSALSRVAQDAPPYCMTVGYSAAVIGLNMVGLRRAKFTHETVSNLKQAFNKLFVLGDLFTETVNQLCEDTCPEVQHLATFCKNSKRGVLRKQRLNRFQTE